MKSSSKLIVALWSEFTELIEQGVPVYFTFTNDLVEEILLREDIYFESGRDTINKAVSELIYVYGTHVSLKPGALNQRECGFSAAILLVCQQVLAVEEMISTELHTENAYFPLLRESLSNSLESISVNPFDYSEFESIWRVLSKEILKISHNSKCITFSFDKTSGVNKAKRYPLSQALFSKEDIIRLIDRIGYQLLRSDNDETIYRAICSNKHLLSRRGQLITTYIWKKDALVRQVKSLSQSVGIANAIKDAVRKKSVSYDELLLRVYVENIDWFDNEYVINLFDAKNNLIDDASTVNGFYREKISNKNYVVLVPSKDGDCWTISDDEYYLESGQQLFVLYPRENKEKVKELVLSLLNVKTDDIVEESITRARASVALRFTTKEYVNKSIYIKNGDICISDEVVKPNNYSFLGGVLVNINQDRYSALSLPTHVIFGKFEKELKGIVKINDAIHDFNNFRSEVVNITTDHNYKIEFDEEFKFSLKVAPLKKISDRRLIYPSYKKQYLPISEVVSLSNPKRCDYDGLQTYEIGEKIYQLKSENKLFEVKSYLDGYQLRNR